MKKNVRLASVLLHNRLAEFLSSVVVVVFFIIIGTFFSHVMFVIFFGFKSSIKI